MNAIVDLNRGSGHVYGVASTAARINALVAAARARPARDYLGGSRIGEPCARKLVYEVQQAPKDHDVDGAMLRIFAAGHVFEDLTIAWLRAAGFDLRTRKRNGEQFGFSVAGGRLRGHIDGVVVAGPDVGIPWPALFEHKALKSASWCDLARHGVRAAKPVYYAQIQLYMAYMGLEAALFTAMNKDTQALHHEAVAFDPAAAQALSDRAVAILRAAAHGELPPRIAASPDHYLCRFCAYARRCWERGR